MRSPDALDLEPMLITREEVSGDPCCFEQTEEPLAQEEH